MTSPNGGASRNTKTILQDALGELLERQEKLQVFADELAEIKHGIKTIEKALAGKTKRGGARQSDGREPQSDEAKDRIVQVVSESIEPLSREEIAEKLGSAKYLHFRLPGLVKDGRLVETDDGKYGIPATAVAAME